MTNNKSQQALILDKRAEILYYNNKINEYKDSITLLRRHINDSIALRVAAEGELNVLLTDNRPKVIIDNNPIINPTQNTGQEE